PKRVSTAMNLHMKMAVTVASLAGATTLLLPALASGTPTPLVIPTLSRVAGPSGPIRPTPTPRPARQLPVPTAPGRAPPPASMGALVTKPDVAVSGTKFTITGTGLPANKSVTRTWGTQTVTWAVGAL